MQTAFKILSRQMDELIVKYLTDNLTNGEKQELKSWLELDKKNRQVFEHIIANWKIRQSDIDRSKIRVYDNLMGLQQKQARKQISFKFFMKAAAVFLLIFASTVLFLTSPIEHDVDSSVSVVTKIEKHSLPGQKLTLRLPDGTSVKLNSGSRLISPEHFQGDTRKVYLEGEAFFEVAKDSLHPFVVETNNIDVQVLGTSFNVRSYPDEEKVSVAVLTGKVRVSNVDDKQQVLMPNEMVNYSAEENYFSGKEQFDERVVLGWKDQQLVFEDESINTILTTLSRWYGVEFDIKARLDYQREFTGSYNNPTLKEVMESISYNFKFEYQINKDNILIY
jgi:transmembrane sensor